MSRFEVYGLTGWRFADEEETKQIRRNIPRFTREEAIAFASGNPIRMYFMPSNREGDPVIKKVREAYFPQVE